MDATHISRSLVLALALAAVSAGAPIASAGDTPDLFRMLPPGDAIATIDVPEMLDRTLPVVLANRPESKKKLDDNIARLKSDFGLDLHTVRRLAISGSPLNAVSAEWVAVLDGPFDNIAKPGALAASLSDYAKRNPRYSVREERRESLTVYVIPEANAAGASVDKFAVAVLDPSHLAWGTPAGVRSAVDVRAGKLAGIASASPVVEAWSASAATAPVRFGLVLPPSLVNEEMQRDKDNPLWKSLAGVRFFFGTLGLENGKDVAARVTARNATTQDARATAATFQALLEFGKSVTKDETAALLDLVTIAIEGDEVTLAIVVPPAQQEPLFKQVVRSE